jgi:hypothetical protein
MLVFGRSFVKQSDPDYPGERATPDAAGPLYLSGGGFV